MLIHVGPSPAMIWNAIRKDPLLTALVLTITLAIAVVTLLILTY